MAIAIRSASRANSSSLVVPSSAGGRPVRHDSHVPVDLHDALPRREAARRRHFLDQRLDVRGQELVRAVAGLADQVKVPGMAVRVLEAEAAFAEIDLARDARFDHPLQRAVDGGPADAMIFALDQIDEIVGAQVSLLAEEDVDDQIALARPLRAGRAEPIEVR